MATVTIDGYRGEPSGHRYLPPGTYTVGDALDIEGRVLPEQLARYIVSLGKGVMTDDAPVADANDEIAPVIARDNVVTKIAPPRDTADVSLDDMTVVELRELAEARGIELDGGYVPKARLIDLLSDAD